MLLVCQKSTISFFRMLKMCGQLYHFASWQTWNMKANKCLRKLTKLFLFNHISVAIYSIIKCLIVFIVISVLRLEYLNLRWESLIVSFCPVYCIILPRAGGKMIQLTTHFEWFVSTTNVTLCLYFFLPSFSQNLTVYCTSKSNKIYPVIKAGKIISKIGSSCPGLLYVHRLSVNLSVGS